MAEYVQMARCIQGQILLTPGLEGFNLPCPQSCCSMKTKRQPCSVCRTRGDRPDAYPLKAKFGPFEQLYRQDHLNADPRFVSANDHPTGPHPASSYESEPSRRHMQHLGLAD